MAATKEPPCCCCCCGCRCGQANGAIAIRKRTIPTGNRCCLLARVGSDRPPTVRPTAREGPRKQHQAFKVVVRWTNPMLLLQFFPFPCIQYAFSCHRRDWTASTLSLSLGSSSSAYYTNSSIYSVRQLQQLSAPQYFSLTPLQHQLPTTSQPTIFFYH